MIGINKQVVEEAIVNFKIRISSYNDCALQRLKKVEKDFTSILSNDEKTFLKKLREFHEKNNLMTLDIFQIEELKSNLQELPKPATALTDKGKVTLKDKIKWALDYSKIRAEFFPEYFQRIGIKACVYCNSQLTVTIDIRRKDYKARFQVDHFYPQGKYPYLSISLYNLYPTCASCNHSKAEDIINFQLYQDTVTESRYSFSIDKASLSSYMVSKKCNDLKVEFYDPDATIKTSLERKFHIMDIYETQKDLAEEIILKAHVYNDAYKQTLQQSFSDLFPDIAVMNRMLSGNYVEPHEIHKRPMAKFTQDITKDIKAHINKEQ